MRRSKMVRMVVTFALLLVFATSAYAFTAANNVDASKAGYGTGLIEGYNITNVTYTVSGAQITGVKFNMNENVPANVAVLFNGGSGTTYVAGVNCWAASATEVECSVSESVAAVNGLTVTAWN